MSIPLFAYGSLMFPEVLAALIQEPTEQSEDAVLHDYSRHALKGKRYPGIVPASGQRVPGRVFHGLSTSAWNLLDSFEGTMYERRELPIVSLNTKRAWVYVLTRESQSLLQADQWCIETFKRVHLPAYLEMCRDFAIEHSAGKRLQGVD